MCTGGCAKCLGGTLIPLTVFGILANILLFFPGGKVIDNNEHLSEEVWFFGGILGSGFLMIFPVLVFLGLKNNDCCGCCGNERCGKRFAMFTSTIFAVIGFLGAGYSFVISAISINKGSKCLMDNSTWGYPFHDGDHLNDKALWSKCREPENVVSWNLTLFSILLIIAVFQMLLCTIQVVNGLLGTLCGDCRCCGCCRQAENQDGGIRYSPVRASSHNNTETANYKTNSYHSEPWESWPSGSSTTGRKEEEH